MSRRQTLPFLSKAKRAQARNSARAIHTISGRRDRPLVKVNCAALPASLIESELFGHEKGAFTGTLKSKMGRFELANGGIIFLDEIGELPIEMQVKLLRVIQSGEFERVGGTQTLHTDVRIIAATNRDLEKAVAENTFREDLFYRLNVFPIHVPPLRERREDIPLLVDYFVQKYAKKIGREINVIPRSVLSTLENYSWPGNIRELENIIEQRIILTMLSWFVDAHELTPCPHRCQANRETASPNGDRCDSAGQRPGNRIIYHEFQSRVRDEIELLRRLNS